MQSLKDLDRKTKHANMRVHSNVFSQTMGPGMLKDELNLNRKKKINF